MSDVEEMLSTNKYNLAALRALVGWLCGLQVAHAILPVWKGNSPRKVGPIWFHISQQSLPVFSLGRYFCLTGTYFFAVHWTGVEVMDLRGSTARPVTTWYASPASLPSCDASLERLSIWFNHWFNLDKLDIAWHSLTITVYIAMPCWSFWSLCGASWWCMSSNKGLITSREGTKQIFNSTMCMNFRNKRPAKYKQMCIHVHHVSVWQTDISGPSHDSTVRKVLGGQNWMHFPCKTRSRVPSANPSRDIQRSFEKLLNSVTT